ncbi:thioredoxin family protein [Paenibacillus sp. HWE-109]|uniref:thioredoxin family protein n=1 Tax=Paenibacillus sp. HWE-109 TaxID=1306526 RepID=UPI001EE01223|nr:thioredoxin family protein [Paenibacillus sp. HWE-109]UKS25899.1 thioredoxin family protein [Paenibacillus sp. HWE-109]
MNIALNLKQYMGLGLTPKQFIDGMTRNQTSFQQWLERFTWKREEDRSFFVAKGESSGLRCLILCTDWCPDVIWNVPVLLQVTAYSKIPTEIFLMEEHLDMMDHFLTNGGRAQPIAVFVNADGDVLGKWGARPAYIQAVMDEFRRNHPDREAPDYQEKVSNARNKIAAIYNAGTEYQDVIVEELRVLFTSWEH